jgi:hypothetical protein
MAMPGHLFVLPPTEDDLEDEPRMLVLNRILNYGVVGRGGITAPATMWEFLTYPDGGWPDERYVTHAEKNPESRGFPASSVLPPMLAACTQCAAAEGFPCPEEPHYLVRVRDTLGVTA